MKKNVLKWLIPLFALSMSMKVMAVEVEITGHVSGNLSSEITAALEALEGSTDFTGITKLTISGENLGEEDYKSTIACKNLEELNIAKVAGLANGNSSGNNGLCTGLKSLKKVILPSTATHIGHGAFNGCTALESVDMEIDGVVGNIFSTNNTVITKILTATFKGCSSLVISELPTNVDQINNEAFRSCTLLIVDEFPSTLQSIGNYAFAGTKIRTKTWPTAITSVGNDAFAATDVAFTVWPENITTIQASIFRTCPNLTNFTIPATVSVIGNNVFTGNDKDRSFTLRSVTPPTVNKTSTPDDIRSTFGANLTKTTLHLLRSAADNYSAWETAGMTLAYLTQDITVNITGNGAVSVAGDGLAGDEGALSDGSVIKAYEAEDITFTCTPDEGYVLGTLLLDGEEITSGQTLTIDEKAQRTLTVTFVQDTRDQKIYTGLGGDQNWSTAANWTGGTPAGEDDIAIIRGNDEVNQIIVDGNQSCAYLQIEGDCQVIIPPDGSLDVSVAVVGNLTENSIQIHSNSTGNGNFKFNGDAPLATVEQHIRTKETDGTGTWQMMTIPVEDLNANPTFAAAWVDRYLTESDSWKREGNNDLIKRGVGYAVNYQAERTITFKGRLTNEDASYTLEGSGFNLIGNPYTASIDISNAKSDWTMENISQSLWVWDVDEAQYMSITLGDIVEEEEYESLSSMQAFFVEATGTPASLTIPYATTTVDNKGLRSGASTPSNRMVKITLSGERYKDCVYLREAPGASPAYDDGWDGKKISSFVAGTPCFYTIEEGDQYNQVSTTDVLRETYLGFSPGEDESYTLSAKVTGDFQAIDLLDLKTGKSYDLLNGNNFTIESLESADEPRFKIAFVSNVSTGTDFIAQEPAKLWIVNNSLHIQSTEAIREVLVYSTDGVELAHKAESAGVTKLDLPQAIRSNVFIVRLVSANGILTQKMINN